MKRPKVDRDGAPRSKEAGPVTFGEEPEGPLPSTPEESVEMRETFPVDRSQRKMSGWAFVSKGTRLLAAER